MKLTLGSCLSLADGWVQFTCTENHTLNQRTFVVCLQLDACSVALESGLWQWQWVSSCAKNGLCWHKGRGHGPNSRQRCQHKHVEQQQSFPPPAQYSWAHCPSAAAVTSTQSPTGTDHTGLRRASRKEPASRACSLPQRFWTLWPS